MLISITHVNADKGYIYSEEKPFTPYTDQKGKLFCDFQKEYGKCISAVYIDTVDGKASPIGWVFAKRVEYEDNYRRNKKDTYLREVWVTIVDDSPNVD